ncbi:type I-E CRISPR-associated protein Cas7/Cse4/CasC [Kitasatospora acidiphila]|uniref:Type I-E CRISPR-associated protein Cas7/Cse4/CasC n=1 Tax=Kitasatospora acidiphila TaxID=2567942 RepID=A0A540WB06_9ACTN|nr:type I-E CRISPR-associated protein Cas7/Cse4/CasC [Kitasatospora acidiphila]TQF05594.1 type I-E CRISPR-associated protein Cas7/Cse4/CasC [Kitasatospora acidiphila]
MIRRLFVDVHILQTVPPANLNRDDNGNPKEAYFGGKRRSRVSSQAWKRATRMHFAERCGPQDLATRTKRIAGQLAKRLQARSGIAAQDAERIAGAVLKPMGITAGKKAGDTAYLLFFGRRQLENIVDLVADDAVDLAALDDEALDKAVSGLPVREQLQHGHPADVALFGRMVADIPGLNVDAATQVAHAISTHATELEFDYYTAVDDENTADETGAGMIGTIGFNSATLYRYATVGVHQLQENLGEDKAALEAVDLFVDSFSRSMPTGYANSFAHRTRPSLVAVVVRADQPVNLVSAYERPVPVGDGVVCTSALRLAGEYLTATRQWGDVPLYAAVCHTLGDADPEAAELAEAFGVNKTFSQLLEGLQAALSSALDVN